MGGEATHTRAAEIGLVDIDDDIGHGTYEVLLNRHGDWPSKVATITHPRDHADMWQLVAAGISTTDREGVTHTPVTYHPGRTVAETLDVSRSTVHRSRTLRQLLSGRSDDGTWRYPTFQFTQIDGKFHVLDGLASILAELTTDDEDDGLTARPRLGPAQPAGVSSTHRPAGRSPYSTMSTQSPALVATRPATTYTTSRNA